MSLRDKATKGFFWNTIGTVGSGLCNLIINIILARLLTPSDFGIIAILVVFTILSETLIDSGFSQALIQDKKANSVDLNTIFFANIFIAILIYVALFIFSPVIAGFYENEKIIDLSRFVFLILIFNSFSIIQKTLYSKNIDFKAMAISALISVVISGVFSIGLAIKGFGVWALAVHLVLSSFLQMIFLWWQSKWRPSYNVSLNSFKKYLTFSIPLLIQGFLDRFVTNLESLLIGKFYTARDVGFYSQGNSLSSYLTQALSNVVQRVTYPVLVKINDEKVKLKEGYRQIIGMVMLFMIPLSLGVIAASENIVLVLFGEKWVQMGVYLQFFIISGLFIALHSSYTNIFLALGKTSKFLKLSLLKQTLKLIVVFSLVNYSVKALVIGVTIIGVITSLIYVYAGGKLISYSLKELLTDLSQLIIAGTIGFILTYIVGVYFLPNNIFIILIAQVLTMMSIYFLILLFLRNEHLYNLLNIYKKMMLKVKV